MEPPAATLPSAAAGAPRPSDRYVGDCATAERLAALFQSARVVCFLDGLKHSANIGGIIRNGSILGMDGVIVHQEAAQLGGGRGGGEGEEGRASLYTSVFKRNTKRFSGRSAESIFRSTTVLYNQEEVMENSAVRANEAFLTVHEVFDIAVRHGFRVFFLENEDAEDIDRSDAFRCSEKVLLVTGNESLGVQDAVRSHAASRPLNIPTCSSVDATSLNAGYATIIALYHFRLLARAGAPPSRSAGREAVGS